RLDPLGHGAAVLVVVRDGHGGGRAAQILHLHARLELGGAVQDERNVQRGRRGAGARRQRGASGGDRRRHGRGGRRGCRGGGGGRRGRLRPGGRGERGQAEREEADQEDCEARAR